MRNLFLLVLIFIGACCSAYGQEIIPFPDLSENHLAASERIETIDSQNYSLYTKDYQDALRKIDNEIKALHVLIENELDESRKTTLESDRNLLIGKRSKLLQEAELLEDLNKFY